MPFGGIGDGGGVEVSPFKFKVSFKAMDET